MLMSRHAISAPTACLQAAVDDHDVWQSQRYARLTHKLVLDGLVEPRARLGLGSKRLLQQRGERRPTGLAIRRCTLKADLDLEPFVLNCTG